MRTRVLFLLIVSFMALPQTLTSQDFALGARVGTLGLGGELALGVSDKIAIRGGVGSLFLDYTGDIEGVEYTVTPPPLMGNVGIDLYPTGGSFRLMAGLMFQGDFEAESGPLSDAEGGIEIGDGVYDEDGQLFGTFSTKSTAPYVGLGFGRHTRGGFGVFMDFAVAFAGDPEVTLSATGDIASVPGFSEDLEKEEQAIENDYPSYLSYWPIISFGLKIPLG